MTPSIDEATFIQCPIHRLWHSVDVECFYCFELRIWNSQRVPEKREDYECAITQIQDSASVAQQ